MLFSRRKEENPLVILHKIHGNKDQSRHIYAFFFQSAGHVRYRVKQFVTRVTTSALKKHLTNWSIDKLSCKNLFGLLILELFQFFTLKDLVEIYKMKKRSEIITIAQ